MHTLAEFDVRRAIYARHAVRSYTAQAVPETLVRELIDAAVHAPTAMHLEPWGFVVVQDRLALKRYSDRAKALVLAQPPSPQAGHFDMLRDPAFNVFYDASTLVVVCRTIPGMFAEADCWLAAENLMLEATASGLGTCCIGFAVQVLNEPDVKQELGIPAEGAAVAPIIVGYPRGRAPAAPRKPARILRWMA